MSPGRNDLCHCGSGSGSGKKYKKCHLDIERDARRTFIEALPVLQAKHQQAQEYHRRLREDFGVHVNYVSPVPWQGGKVWAIGSRVYPPAQRTRRSTSSSSTSCARPSRAVAGRSGRPARG